jgi:NADH:ubiquinone oxidoreductase subunit 6 (subunit J)
MTTVLDWWPILLPAGLGCGALCWLLPRPRAYPPLLGALAAALALVLAGTLLVHIAAVSLAAVLFYAFSGIVVTAGGLLLTQKQPARAALSFALVVLSTGGLFLLQGAPFLMAATVIIYAGAIVVTFLFVIMLAQQEGLSDADCRSREPFLACVAGFVLVSALLYVVKVNYDARGLDLLLAQLREASDQRTAERIAELLGPDEDDFFAQLRRQVETVRGVPNQEKLLRDIDSMRLNWKEWKDGRDAGTMRERLEALTEALERIRVGYGSVLSSADAPRPAGFGTPPAGSSDNVAALGRTLFTDYLLAVELAGMLLLVATIGAIVIAERTRTRNGE